jgi:hypothetical protein
MNGDTRTHKNEDAISIVFPALGVLVVLFLCGFGVYGEERPRAVTEIGSSLRWLILCPLHLIAIYFIYVCELRENVSRRHTPELFPLSGSRPL